MTEQLKELIRECVEADVQIKFVDQPAPSSHPLVARNYAIIYNTYNEDRIIKEINSVLHKVKRAAFIDSKSLYEKLGGK